MAELAAHLEQHGASEDGLGAPRARPAGDSPAVRAVWRTLREKAKMPEARFHDARHTFASVLLSGGVYVPAAAEYLGHSPAVLLRT